MQISKLYFLLHCLGDLVAFFFKIAALSIEFSSSHPDKSCMTHLVFFSPFDVFTKVLTKPKIV